MNKKVKTARTKQIEGIELLTNYKSSIIEVDIVDFEGECTTPTRYFNTLTTILTSKYLTLEDELHSIQIRILREQIFDIEGIMDNQLIIHTCNCDIILNKL